MSSISNLGGRESLEIAVNDCCFDEIITNTFNLYIVLMQHTPQGLEDLLTMQKIR